MREVGRDECQSVHAPEKLLELPIFEDLSQVVCRTPRDIPVLPQQAAKGASGKGPRQKTSKSSKNNFQQFSTFLARGKNRRGAKGGKPQKVPRSTFLEAKGLLRRSLFP